KANNVIIFVILFLSSVSYCFADMKILKINQSHYMSPYNKEPGAVKQCAVFVPTTTQTAGGESLHSRLEGCAMNTTLTPADLDP
ncbi:hypothetical protein MJN47_32165, partial [Salmonella enterica subsp. enterica serovar Lubbock]|nr:hypothetical protein [Salmonella enterica subsp. enterica serovar Lubbock]